MTWIDAELALITLAAMLSPTTLTFSVLALVVGDRPRRTGFWFYQTHKGFDFEEVASIRVREVRKRRNTEEEWDLQLRSGGTRTIDPGDLWDYATAEIVAALAARGIPVVPNF